MAIKLIAIDMDGTLLLPDHTISPAVKAAIAAARERGVNVVLTTGRPYAGVHSYLKELHMDRVVLIQPSPYGTDTRQADVNIAVTRQSHSPKGFECPLFAQSCLST